MSEAVVVAAVRRDLDALCGPLASWLTAHIDGASDMRVGDLCYPSGAGLSNETILFDASWFGDGREQTNGFVLRLQPGGHRIYMELEFEKQFLLQKILGEQCSVPIPEMLWYEADEALFGAPFFVMRRLHGKVAVSFPPYTTHGWIAETTPTQRAKIWRNGVEAMARLHHVPIEAIGLLSKPQHGADGWEQEWNYWQKSHAWARGDLDLPVCDRAIEWLKTNIPAERKPGLCWNDARLGNLMFDDAFEIIAVMDWEGASLGGSLQDLGFWLVLDDVMETATGVLLEGFGTRAETIALWERVTGASAKDILWYEVFGGFKLASHVLRLLSLSGATRPGHDFHDNGATRYIAKKLGLAAPTPLLKAQPLPR